MNVFAQTEQNNCNLNKKLKIITGLKKSPVISNY